MPTVTVRTMFDLAKIVGRTTTELAVEPGGTVRTALEALIAMHGALRDRLFDPATGTLLSYLFVEMNGRDIRSLQGLETPVADGDSLFVLIPVAGGSPGRLTPTKMLDNSGSFDGVYQRPCFERGS